MGILPVQDGIQKLHSLAVPLKSSIDMRLASFKQMHGHETWKAEGRVVRSFEDQVLGSLAGAVEKLRALAVQFVLL